MNSALTEAIEDLALPEHMVRALVADYLDFLAKQSPEKSQKLEARLQAENDLHDRLYFEAQGSILASTLMMTIDADVELDDMLDKTYGRQQDEDLLAMRKELVSRAMGQNKGTPGKAGLSAKVVSARKKKFCQDDDQSEAAS